MTTHDDESRWVRDLLASLPDPAMPSSVTASIAAAIQAEAATLAPVVDISRRSRMRKLAQLPPWLAGAAAAVVIGAIVVPVALHTGTSKSGTSARATDTAGQSEAGQDAVGGLTSTGVNYTPDNLAFGVRELLGGPAVAVVPKANSSTVPDTTRSTSGSATKPQTFAAARPSSDCLAALDHRESGSVLALEAVTWTSAPAYLLVYPDPKDRSRVVAVVVAQDCSGASPHILYEDHYPRTPSQ